MKTLNLVQGSSAWQAVRLNHFTASEAPIMMGASPYMTREELLDMKTTGITAEVNDQQQRIFDRGHALEKLALPLAEKVLGVDLYPVTGCAEIDGLPLLASFDGMDMLEELGFEHKTYNASSLSRQLQQFFVVHLSHSYSHHISSPSRPCICSLACPSGKSRRTVYWAGICKLVSCHFLQILFNVRICHQPAFAAFLAGLSDLKQR